MMQNSVKSIPSCSYPNISLTYKGLGCKRSPTSKRRSRLITPTNIHYIISSANGNSPVHIPGKPGINQQAHLSI